MKKTREIIQQMTLEEKASLCSGLNFWYLKGLDRLGVPSIMVTDGPHGLRKQAGDADHVGLNESVPATCFPTASALAATWNRDLIYEVGAALGEECRQEKVGVILGPGANIKRSPLGGRNFEYFSEDPYLTGEMAKSHINGVQSQGVGTSLKHYAANSQETRRMTSDSILDERTLREIYLTGFEIAVKEAQPWTVMCAYNRINGTYASDNRTLMTEILKDEWGHQGLVVTDWGAMNDRVKALKAGTELEMPGTQNDNDEKIVAAVQAGELDEAVLDQAVERILNMIFEAEEALREDFSYDADAHHLLARRAAGEGAVLLKNEGALLPLSKDSHIALIGRFAKNPRYQGAGSSRMNPTRLENLFQELAELISEENLIYAPGYDQNGATDEDLLQEALDAASQADVVVIHAGLMDIDEVEGLDRKHLNLPEGHNILIETIAAQHQKVVVVLSNGAPVAMPWVNSVAAILEGYLGGQAGGGALADILTGRVNPSGKLAETFPYQLEDTPAQPFPGGPATVEYRESLYVGYRWYDTADVDVLFPFGHGLSYTTFEYSALEVEHVDKGVNVTFHIKNTGDLAGKEIVQIYVRDPQSTHFRPEKELKGFEKIELQPGEEKVITLSLGARAFAYYDGGNQDWVVEPGLFEILVGSSSRDIQLRAAVEMTDAQGAVSEVDPGKLISYYAPSKDQGFNQREFEVLLGRPVPPNLSAVKGEFTLNTPLSEMQTSWIGRQFYKLVGKNVSKMIEGNEDSPEGLLVSAMISEMPLRTMLMMGGPLDRKKLEALVLMTNGQFFKGLLAMIK